MTETARVEDSGKPNPIRIGNTLSESISLVARHPGVFGSLALLFSLPYMVFYYFDYFDTDPSRVHEGGDVAFLLVIFGFLALDLVLQLVLSAAVASGTFLSMQGKPVTFQGCLRVGFARFWPVLGVSVLSVLAIGAGFVLLVIPAAIVLAWLYVAVPVVVIERKGIVASLGRSRELTRGSRIPILALVVALWIFDWLLESLIGLVAGSSLPVTLLLALVSVSVSTLFAAMFPGVVYFKLRMAKEGVDVNQIAAVFD